MAAEVQPTATTRRARIRVTGTVQGVGFRPFVYRLAGELGLAGWVLNDTRGVLIEVEGGAAVALFLERLRAEAPPLAVVEQVDATDVAVQGEGGFAIRGSDSGGEAAAPVTPDSATCADCLAEMRDPGDRRHRYPFVNCTNCGPRFTIVEGVPYDRPLTTMSGFTMCGVCQAEYEDPADRRFHAQPNACPACGPRARLLDASGEDVTPTATQVSELTGSYSPSNSDTWSGGTPADAVEAAAKALDAGRIVAIKGLGGYHLACRADDDEVVTRLRSRKHREDKPFAVMVASIEAARALADLGPIEEQLLASHERPIVLAPRRATSGVPVDLCSPVGDKGQPESRGTGLAAGVAPGFREIGLMLAYTPLHHLLLDDCGGPLVMTSGNVSDEPIAYRDDEALERLAAIADLFLTHDRPIHIRTDDSVARAVMVGERVAPFMLRRSRGFVPASLELPVAAGRPILACGAEQKNTFCLAKGGHAWVGHHIGDLENYETLRSFGEGIPHFERLFAVAPELCAHDLHPEYLSTKYAVEREGVELVGVQHHHAHLAACLAEHGERGPAVGLVFDGTGFGLDGTVWGGEVLVGGLDGFERAAHLLPVPLPGAAAAIREPWRMACAWLRAAAGFGPALPPALAAAVEPRDWRNCEALIDSGLGSPMTSSMGRLFDAVGVMCGAPARVSYEGQAAIALEAMTDPGERGQYEMPLESGGVLDARPSIRAVAADLDAGVPPDVVAARFHNTVVAAGVTVAAEIAAAVGLDTVVLSGGVFQNRRLLEGTAAGLGGTGLRVLVPERLPPNDGGISFGQAAIVAATGGG